MEIHLQEKYWMKEAWNVIYISCQKKKKEYNFCQFLCQKFSLQSTKWGRAKIELAACTLTELPDRRAIFFVRFKWKKSENISHKLHIPLGYCSVTLLLWGRVGGSVAAYKKKKRHERGEKTVRHRFHRLPCSTVISSQQLGQCWFRTHIRAHTLCVRVCTEGT